jgi:membrane protein YdbS with pleckstrin-like domain
VPRDLLADDEEVLTELRPHWAFLLGPIAATAGGVAVAIAVVVAFPSAPVAVAWLLVACAVVPALWLGGRALRWSGMRLILTTQRLIVRKGVLRRDVRQLRLLRVGEVHIVQSLFERIVGSGQLAIQLDGESPSVVVTDVRRPKQVQRLLNNRLDALGTLGPFGGRPGGYGERPPAEYRDDRSASPQPGLWLGDRTPPQGVPAHRRPGWPGQDPVDLAAVVPTGPEGRPVPSVSEQLIQLDDLRRRGIVTTAEFEAKKAELLNRL